MNDIEVMYSSHQSLSCQLYTKGKCNRIHTSKPWVKQDNKVRVMSFIVMFSDTTDFTDINISLSSG